MSTEVPIYWAKKEPPTGLIFALETRRALDLGVPDLNNVVLPVILTPRLYASNDYRIYVPKPALYLSLLYSQSTPAAFTFLPCSVPLPSLMLKGGEDGDFYLREIPTPNCANWPPWSLPLVAPLLAQMTSKGLASVIARTSHIGISHLGE